MKQFDFWEIANERIGRGLSFHCWQVDFDFNKNFDLITYVIDQLEIWPAKVDVYRHQMAREKIVRWNNKSDATFDGFDSIERIHVYSALPRRLSTMELAWRSFQIDRESSWAYFSGANEVVTLDLSLTIASRFMEAVKVGYGFSSIDKMDDCFLFHAGQPSSGLPDEQRARVDAHEQVKFLPPENPKSLAHRLLDVFELNILNPAHLEIDVKGVALKNWIGAGNHGTLRQVSGSAFAWIVPDEIRPAVREVLLKSACLVVPV